LARYRKIHLFDLDLPDTKCRESDSVAAGAEVVTAELQLSGEQSIGLGLTICYDLRFAGLFEKLTTLGARMITVPSAFTEKTGRDHWEVLLRARAIENQVFILAANQFGTVAGTPTSYGRSMIIDPWGTVLAQAADGEGFAIAMYWTWRSSFRSVRIFPVCSTVATISTEVKALIRLDLRPIYDRF
jgi:predicted amidohydrolase